MIFVRSSYPCVGPQTGVVMSMQPRPWPDVPEQTARMAGAASRKGNLAMRIRDELGQVYDDGRFTGAFGVRGRPGISPGQLMIASVLGFSENLTDRQAAEAVRDRITWKYALGLELDDPGFDPSVLSEFRARLVAGDLTGLALDALLERLGQVGLVTAGGRARTDSTHVLGAIRSLNRLELAGETLRAGLEALAVAAPEGLTEVIDGSWQDVYGARIDNLRLPESATTREKLMVQFGRDGYHLLDQIYGPGAPGWLRELPAVAAVRRIWIQQFYRDVQGDRQEVRRRMNAPEGDGLPLPFGGTGRAGRPAARPHAGLAAAAGPFRPSQSRSRVRQGRIHLRLRRPPSDLPAAGHQLVLIQHHPTRHRSDLVSWATTACGPCPVRELCTRGKRRHITIRSHELHEALTAARAEQNTDQWKTATPPAPGSRAPCARPPMSPGSVTPATEACPRPPSNTTSPPPRST